MTMLRLFKLNTGLRHRFRIIVLAILLLLISLTVVAPSAAQSSNGLGVGRGHGMEVGINLDELNRIKGDIANGLYERPCTPEEHNPLEWHTLVNVERKCHYNHQHGDDPNYVNDIFGAPGAWFGAPGQSISYPWQTFPATTANEPNTAYIGTGKMENEGKHEGYGWVVRRDQPCPAGNCVTDFRLEFHGIFGAMGAVTRYHSFSLEARVCINATDPSSCGIVRYGGWADFGILFTTSPNDISCTHDVNEIRIPLAADNLFRPIDRPESRDEIRCHPNVATLPSYPSTRPLAEWWAHGPGETRFQLRAYDPIGNINPANPSEWQFFCTYGDANCRFNQSIMSVFIGYTLHIHETAAGGRPVDSNGDGRTDYSGYATRWGGGASSCTAAALDCVPLVYDNVVLNFFENREARYAQTVCEDCPKVDYDLSPPSQQWITWFFTKYGGITPPPQPTPPPEPTQPPPPTVPTVRIDVNPTVREPGGDVSVTLNLFNVSDLYGLQAECMVDPAILQGTTRTDGEAFSAATSFFVDQGFQSDGKWMVAASRLQPNPSIFGNASAFTLHYTVTGEGTTTVTCSVLGVDENGGERPLEIINGNFQSQMTAPTPLPTIPPPTMPPPSETPVPTEPTEPSPAETPVPGTLSVITGTANYQNAPDNAGITVQLVKDGSVLTQLTTAENGVFKFTDVPVGEYQLLLSAPLHLAVIGALSITTDGMDMDMGILTLPAGDTDNSGKVDILDASWIGINFGGDAALAPNADLNYDNLINIRDLVLVGSNFDLQGPVPVN